MQALYGQLEICSLQALVFNICTILYYRIAILNRWVLSGKRHIPVLPARTKNLFVNPVIYPWSS